MTREELERAIAEAVHEATAGIVNVQSVEEFREIEAQAATRILAVINAWDNGRPVEPVQ